MKSKWHIPLSAKDPGYQRELARCMFYNKRWDSLTDEEKKAVVPSLWDQKYSPKAQMKPGVVIVRRGKDNSLYGIPFPSHSHEYRRALGACRHYHKEWKLLTETEQQWNPVVVDKTAQESREQKVGFNQPIVSGDTIGKTGCFIAPDGTIEGEPKIDGMVFDSREQKVKKNCQDLCFIKELVTTLVISARERTDATTNLADEVKRMNNEIHNLGKVASTMESMVKAVENQSILLGELIEMMRKKYDV